MLALQQKRFFAKNKIDKNKNKKGFSLLLHCKVEPDFCLAIETNASQFSKLTPGKHLTENGDSPCTKSTIRVFLSSLFYCCSIPSFYVGILLCSL